MSDCALIPPPQGRMASRIAASRVGIACEIFMGLLSGTPPDRVLRTRPPSPLRGEGLERRQITP